MDDRTRVGMHRIHGKSMYVGHFGHRTDPTRTRQARRDAKALRLARKLAVAR